MKRAIIWRESVYKSGHCPKCGEKLFDTVSGEPNGKRIGVIPFDNESIFCAGCGMLVAVVRPYNGDKTGPLGGRWLEDGIN